MNEGREWDAAMDPSDLSFDSSTGVPSLSLSRRVPPLTYRRTRINR